MNDGATLKAFRLADSFLPIGTYAVSYGLEQFIQDDLVSDATDLEALLSTYLRRQLGSGDLIALWIAHTGACDDDIETVGAADRRLTAVTLSAEFRETARNSGIRLLSIQRELHDDERLEWYAEQVEDGSYPGNHAVVLGLVTGLTGIEARIACLLHCHGFVTGLLGAAQRLLPLGHTDAQRILDRLKPAIADALEASAGRSLDSMAPFTPLVDVLSAEHERAD